ncbi:MAG: sulfate adenylyltransferase subunit 1 [Acidimicrobiia bacterium]
MTGHAITAGPRSLLRVATAGSVDDGKSTLIGRLLHDSKSILEDQLAAVEAASARRGDGSLNLALLTDGLRAEREQGITIDVAWRFFATPARSFIVADSPGHEQYTRNMVTGASVSDVAVILVDARHGIVEQTRRHAFLAAHLGVGHLVLAVNKMDLVDWDERVFAGIVKEFGDYVAALPRQPLVHAIPVSALLGGNVVDRSNVTDWYDGPALLELLEIIEPVEAPVLGGRVAVQSVIRPLTPEHHDYRGYAGQVSGGALRVGDDVLVLPAGQRTTVSAIDTFDGPLAEAVPGQAIVVLLADDLDVGRGDTIVVAHDRAPMVTQVVELDLCWMTEQPLTAGARVWVKHGTRTARAIVTDLVSRLDVNSLAVQPRPSQLALNDLGRVRVKVSTPLAIDTYDESRVSGRCILIDDASNATAAAAMVVGGGDTLT